MRRPVSVRWSDRELDLLTQAASQLRMSRAAFARSAAVQMARRVLEEEGAYSGFALARAATRPSLESPESTFDPPGEA